MKYVDRLGNISGNDSVQDKFLKALYANIVGRFLVKILINPSVSKLGGSFLNSKYSKKLIKPFIKSNHIDLSLFEDQDYKSYNEFFIRKIKKNQRKIDLNYDTFISPCDSKLSVYEIKEDSHFYIKNTLYNTNSLLREKKLANNYKGGYAFIFRLTVDDYHRYCYVDNGFKTDNRKIKGVLHTVNPIANDIVPIYKENSREYSVLKSENFGNILMMEVGALMVGKIVNYHQSRYVNKGQEKGRFEFGGSTVILLVEKDKVIIDQDILNNSLEGFETKVMMGEKIGVKAVKAE